MLRLEWHLKHGSILVEKDVVLDLTIRSTIVSFKYIRFIKRQQITLKPQSLARVLQNISSKDFWKKSAVKHSKAFLAFKYRWGKWLKFNKSLFLSKPVFKLLMSLVISISCFKFSPEQKMPVPSINDISLNNFAYIIYIQSKEFLAPTLIPRRLHKQCPDI